MTEYDFWKIFARMPRKVTHFYTNMPTHISGLKNFKC